VEVPWHLFFYGVLRPDVAQWPFLEGLGAGLPATTRGALYAIPDPDGWYPAMLPGTGLVHGACHEVGAVDLAAVDAFEGADYARVEVECAKGMGGSVPQKKPTPISGPRRYPPMPNRFQMAILRAGWRRRAIRHSQASDAAFLPWHVGLSLDWLCLCLCALLNRLECTRFGRPVFSV